MIARGLVLRAGATWAMSIVLAATVWGYLYYDSTDQISADVEVRLVGIKGQPVEGVTLQDKHGRTLPGNKIRVTLAGPRGRIQSINKNEIGCSVDVGPLVSNPHHIALKREHFSLPENVELAVPGGWDLWIAFERLVELKAPIHPLPPSSAPAPDFEFAGYEVVPREVRVLVPKSHELQVRNEGIPLVAPDISGWATSRGVPPVAAVSFSVSFLEEVRLTALVEVRRIRKVVQKIPIQIMLPPARLPSKAELGLVTTCDVTLEGSASVLERIGPGGVRAYVLVDREPDAGGGPFDLKIAVHLVGGSPEQEGLLRIVKVEPEMARLSLNRK